MVPIAPSSNSLPLGKRSISEAASVGVDASPMGMGGAQERSERVAKRVALFIMDCFSRIETKSRSVPTGRKGTSGANLIR